MSDNDKIGLAVVSIAAVTVAAAVFYSVHESTHQLELSMSQYRLDYERLSGKVEAWREQGLVPGEGAK